MDEGYKTQFVNNLPILLPIDVSTLLYIKKIIKRYQLGKPISNQPHIQACTSLHDIETLILPGLLITNIEKQSCEGPTQCSS